ncbi:hypothetical protein [Adlercreutzia caecimuris]|uniref:hypothetical protein n=1 Tax=Adlercreutzia caecimuris TaxID=671266 RepID=UPI000EBAF1BA|nr:hypothetical protein [Adlercreutzia caecimuris]NBJ66502.1 hypothetical protein [Adlercreutzia caecimuris]
MKHASANHRNRSGAWKGKALATLLAVSLAATPMAAFATDGESAAAAAIAETEAAAPSAPEKQPEAAGEDISEAEVVAPSVPEKQPEAAGENETLTTSVTVYYCEMVYYDDPSFNDPTGFRLLGSHTFDGVKVGEEINLWEYAKDIPDFVHFDGWAVNPIASANPEENLVQMNYFRTKSPSSVNYYLVTDGAETPEDAPIDPSMGEVDGESVAFWKMGSYEVESLRLGTEISSDACAVSLEGLTYLDADKAAIAVDAVPSRNEINLFYAADPADQPDNAPAPDAEPSPQPDGDKPGEDTDGAAPTPGDVSGNTSGNGSPSVPEVDGPAASDSGNEGAADVEATEDETGSEQDGATVVTDENASDASDSGERDSDAALQEAAERGVLTLPQTSDGAVAFAGIASVVAVAAAVTLAASRRRRNE